MTRERFRPQGKDFSGDIQKHESKHTVKKSVLKSDAEGNDRHHLVPKAPASFRRFGGPAAPELSAPPVPVAGPMLVAPELAAPPLPVAELVATAELEPAAPPELVAELELAEPHAAAPPATWKLASGVSTAALSCSAPVRFPS